MTKDDRKGRRNSAPAKVRGAEVPHCCTCSKPLARLPASDSHGRTRVYQCSDCFFAGTGRAAGRSGAVASERSRWLDGVTRDATR